MRTSKALTLACALTLVGCAAADPTGEAPDPTAEAPYDDADELQTRAESLSYYTDPNTAGCIVHPNGSSSYWAAGSTLDLCFTGPEAGNATLTTGIRNAINDTWGRVVNLTFRWNGTCPATISAEWISIFPTAGGNGGIGSPGRKSRLNGTQVKDCPAVTEWNSRSDVQIVIRGDAGPLVWSAAHEFGHVLGFFHEHQRSDNNTATGTMPNCPAESAVAGSDAWITKYDPASVMSYCGNVYGRGANDGTLTSLDILGGEMFYPRSLTNHRVACVDQCFSYGDGGAIVRTTGSITSDWKARGAQSIVMRWNSTTGAVSSEYVAASRLPAGASTFSYTFTDFRGRANSGSATVQNSNAMYAAVLTQL